MDLEGRERDLSLKDQKETQKIKREKESLKLALRGLRLRE